MHVHPAVENFTRRLKNNEFGGAAEVAEEEIKSLLAVVEDSQAVDTNALASEVDEAVVEILRALHSLAPPVNALHRVMGSMENAMKREVSRDELKADLIKSCEDFLAWADTSLEKVARYGAEKIKDGDVVFTYSMSSTVWRIFRLAKSQSKAFSVIVTESRPSDEGFWTVKEMDMSDIPISVSIDAAIGELVPGCDSVFIGSDAISSNGIALCKTGSYPTALVAGTHGVPFYIAADTLKFDTTTLIGLPFHPRAIERRYLLDDEYPERVNVVGHYFDETPPHLVTAIITEIGLIHPTAVISVMREMKLSERLSALLPAWAHGEL